MLQFCRPCSDQTDQEADEAMAKEIEKAAQQIVSEFEQGMQEVMENLEKAQMAFDDLSGRFCIGGVWVVAVVQGCICAQVSRACRR
jgi:hypothetical protein